MDVISQGVVGAIASQSIVNAKHLAKAALIGAVAGMLPDLDIFIRSSDDPLLALELHRHFSHSLIFIPIGGLIAALLLYPLLAKRWGLSFLTTWLWSSLGYATHGLLDGCTSYGTLLLWPFSDQRISWDTMPIIDPLFTLPLLALVLFASFRKRRFYLYIALVWAFSYLTLGYVQHERALNYGQSIAEQRGHEPVRLEAKPTLGNILVWKLIYEANDRYYIDGLRLGLTEKRHWQGESIPKLNTFRDFPWLKQDMQQAKDIERFRWFTQDHLAVSPYNPAHIIDMRYTQLPHKLIPLWGIAMDEDAAPDQHIDFISRGDMDNTNMGNNFSILWGMIKGNY
jgi:inner membrane protein